MEKNDFNSSISASISANEAIKKISNVPEWWGITFTGSAEKQNDKFTVKMGGNSFFNFIVTELTPGERVVWLVTDCNMPWYSDKTEWANTRLIFDLHENDGVTELKFTHEGLVPEKECYERCAHEGWDIVIKDYLFNFIATGKSI
jgi:uncharacterized protein YndB with AHSA1/START domain